MVGPPLPPEAVPDEATLQNVLQQFLAMMQRGQINVKMVKQILSVILYMDSNKYQAETLFLGAECLQVYTRYHNKLQWGTPNVAVFARRATELLDVVSKSPLMQRPTVQSVVRLAEMNAFMTLRNGAQASQRLRELVKPLPHTQVAPDALIQFCMSGAELGQWESMREKVRPVLARNPRAGQTMRTFHLAAQKNPTALDLEVIFRIADELKLDDAPASQLKWCEYRIVSTRIRFKRAVCKDQAIAQQKRDQFNTDGEWKDVPLAGDAIIQRRGAVARMMSTSKPAIPVFGPCDDKNITVSGYTDQGQVRQTETYRLRKSKSQASMFKGKYIVKQGPTNVHSAVPKFEVVFDVEITVKKVQ
eukprot:TRINITY_DN66917_c3_g1_i2.p1 TRINITY_DN66917_c3_g1~~TRINITY_DN66917_c3_g1_i2.p1  ORF type:complete len:360 (-),score=217.01 TRINITY_DN66917_c3_g1_i2:60-1139(-)